MVWTKDIIGTRQNTTTNTSTRKVTPAGRSKTPRILSMFVAWLPSKRSAQNQQRMMIPPRQAAEEARRGRRACTASARCWLADTASAVTGRGIRCKVKRVYRNTVLGASLLRRTTSPTTCGAVRSSRRQRVRAANARQSTAAELEEGTRVVWALQHARARRLPLVARCNQSRGSSTP